MYNLTNVDSILFLYQID